MTRLFLLFHGRFPSEKAASLFTAKNAESFAEQGVEVTLVVPKRNGVENQNAFDFYKVKNNFKIVYLPTIDIFSIPFISKIAFWISMLVFSFKTHYYLKREAKKDDLIYSNEILPLFLASFISSKCFYEMHDFPESKLSLFGIFIKRMSYILVHNKWKLQEITKLYPAIPQSKFLYEPNAVDLRDFNIDISTSDARKKLNLPLDKKIAIYTGHLYVWKGVDVLAEATKLFPDNFLTVFIGGTDKDTKAFKEKYSQVKQIMIVGHKPHSDIPLWQKAGDVLVLPNTAKEKISLYYTSPMKLFEYMASKKPIIASDIPSIREIVDENSAIMVSPDSSQKLCNAILSTIGFDNKNIIENAFKKVENHTWQKRAGRILNFVK